MASFVGVIVVEHGNTTDPLCHVVLVSPILIFTNSAIEDLFAFIVGSEK